MVDPYITWKLEFESASDRVGSRPWLAVRDDGYFVLVWAEQQPWGPDRVRLCRGKIGEWHTESMVSWPDDGTPLALNDTLRVHPRVDTSPTGHFYVTWLARFDDPGPAKEKAPPPGLPFLPTTWGEVWTMISTMDWLDTHPTQVGTSAFTLITSNPGTIKNIHASNSVAIGTAVHPNGDLSVAVAGDIVAPYHVGGVQAPWVFGSTQKIVLYTIDPYSTKLTFQPGQIIGAPADGPDKPDTLPDDPEDIFELDAISCAVGLGPTPHGRIMIAFRMRHVSSHPSFPHQYTRIFSSRVPGKPVSGLPTWKEVKPPSPFDYPYGMLSVVERQDIAGPVRIAQQLAYNAKCQVFGFATAAITKFGPGDVLKVPLIRVW